jgi:hypothetical protein
MQCLETRIESFKRAKGRKAFPHHGRGYERLTPTALAEAGFFYNPDADMPDDDTCNCFLCGLQLGGWEAGDDPFAEHVKREGVCAWKELVCRLQLAEDGEGRLR